MILYKNLVVLIFLTSPQLINVRGYARSTALEPQAIPLPPSTTSVKCKCQPVTEEHHSHEEAQSRSDTNEDIEIEIYPEPSSSSQNDAPVNNQFKVYRTHQLGSQANYFFAPFMQLGESTGPFQGPRRRKKRNPVQHESGKSTNNVYYVYPVNYSPPKNEIRSTKNEQLVAEDEPLVKSKENDQSVLNVTKEDSPQDVTLKTTTDKDLMDPQKALEASLEAAWEEYGDPLITPGKYFETPISRSDTPPQPLPQQLPQNPYLKYLFQPTYSYQNQFQRKQFNSPWDNRITQTPPINPDLPQPSPFAPILQNYIDFEVNNHEGADFLRKILFGFMVGVLILGWIGLGVFFGIIPFSLLLGEKKLAQERAGSNELKFKRDNEFNELSDKVHLALDADWLKRLESRVRVDEYGRLIATVARCCIRPSKNEADCVLIPKHKVVKVDSANQFKCSTDLIYNFTFGLDED